MNRQQRTKIAETYTQSLTPKLRDRFYNYHLEEFIKNADAETTGRVLYHYAMFLFSTASNNGKEILMSALVADNMLLAEKEVNHIADKIWGEV